MALMSKKITIGQKIPGERKQSQEAQNVLTGTKYPVKFNKYRGTKDTSMRDEMFRDIYNVQRETKSCRRAKMS